MRVRTGCPSGPVWSVFSGYFSMVSATALAFSLLPQYFTPPSRSAWPTSCPAPRPPAWICAFTMTPPPLLSWSNAAAASSAVLQTMCLGTFAPAAASNSLAWYSWTFIVGS